MTTIEIISVVFGLIYVVLAARENIWCWPAALINTGLAIPLFWSADYPMQSLLHLYYFAMAIVGWWQWKYGKLNQTKLIIHRWHWQTHLLALVIIAVLSVAIYYGLTHITKSENPLLDTFVSVASVVTTWMVTRKILENWLYWLFINTLGAYLSYSQELYFYSGLYFVYLIIAVYGYQHWRQQLHAKP